MKGFQSQSSRDSLVGILGTSSVLRLLWGAEVSGPWELGYRGFWVLGGKLRHCLLSALSPPSLRGRSTKGSDCERMSQSICSFKPVITAVGLELSVTTVTGDHGG